MSNKTIRLFQEAYPQHKPSPSMQLRHEAAKIRAKAQSFLSQAHTLEAIAAELERKDQCKQ